MLRSGAPLPSLAGATPWLGLEPAPEELRGRPAVVHFWAMSCHLCKEQMPVLRAIEERFAPRGVAFVSIHMPRQESDTRLPDVVEAVRDLGMREPVAVDGEHALGDRFETGGIWPMYFLFDAEGKLRSRSGGAAGLGVIESALERIVPLAA